MDPFASVEVVNRRSVPYEDKFDGVVIRFAPHQRRHYPPNVAIELVTRSYLRLSLATGVPKDFALGITGDAQYPTDPLEGELASQNPIECLDRQDDYQLTETEPKALTQHGAQSLGIGKKDKTVPPMPGEEETVAATGDRVPAAPAHEMKPKRFVNAAMKPPPKRGGFSHVEGGPTRVVSKSS